MTLKIHVHYAIPRQSPNALPSRRELRTWVQAALRDSSGSDGDGCEEITIRLATEEECRELNQRYRSKNDASNVLAFPYATEPYIEGDLLLCPSVVEQEARTQAKTLSAHYAHLVVHGTLHLQGWDHQTPVDAEAMENRECEILAKLGYDDPYA